MRILETRNLRVRPSNFQTASISILSFLTSTLRLKLEGLRNQVSRESCLKSLEFEYLQSLAFNEIELIVQRLDVP